MTSNQETAGGNSPIIDLIISEEVQKEQLVTRFLYDYKSRSVILFLNHNYGNIPISSPVRLEYWDETIGWYRVNLRNNGVAENHIIKLEHMLNDDDNQKRITDHYRYWQLEETSIGQRKRKERDDKIRNTTPREVSLSEALLMNEGKVKIKGMFVGGSSKVEKMYTKIGFRCDNCFEIQILDTYSERPRLQSEIPHEFTPKNLSKQQCDGCLNKSVKHEPYQELVSALRVELRDDETSNDPPSTDVILFNVLPNDVPWNEAVKIMGSIQQVRVKDKCLPHIFVGLGPDPNPIERIGEIESTVITPEDEKKIQEFLGKYKSRIFDALAELVEPSHIGDVDAKKGILMCAANTGIGTKHRINVCFLGETGLAKTALAKDATRLVIGSKFASATDSTTNSLICVVDGESGHFRFGPVVTTNNAICVVDEIGRMPKEEQARLLGPMGPDGTLYFGRFGITRELPASAGFILTSNPDSISGKFRYHDKIDVNEFPFLGPFKDRVDLVFIFRTNRDPKYLKQYGYSKFQSEDNLIALRKTEGENYQFLRKWIVKGKEIANITFSAEAEVMMTDYFTEVMTPDDSQSSNRLHDTLCKCCIAIARLKLKDTVEAEDAKEVIEFYDKQLKYWSQIKTSIPHDPRDQAYEEMVKKLSAMFGGGPVEFIKLLQAVCEDNADIDIYTQKIDKDTGKRDWNVRTNIKIRQIRDKFTKGPREERILVLNLHPLTIAWKETYAGGDKPIDPDIIVNDSGDISDIGDMTEEPNKKKYSSETDQTKNDNERISNDGLNSDITNITNITKESTNSQNDLEHNSKDNNTPEDYEDYVARGKKTFAIEDQKLIARQILGVLSRNIKTDQGMEKEIPISEYREALKSSGITGDIDVIIEGMVKDRIVERNCKY